MTKEELVSKIAKEAGMAEKEVGEIINIFIGEVKKKLDEGETVDIPGFGNFTISGDK